MKKHRLWLVIVSLLLLAGVDGFAQQAVERVYADAEGHDGSKLLGIPLFTVSNPNNASDGNKDTHSTITITALGNVWQQLTFSELPGANDPVHVKLGTTTGLASLLSGLTLQAYNGNTAVGSSYTLGSLIGLLNGADQADIVLPAPGVPYNSVRISYSGVALGGGINLYEAYFYKPVAGPIACDQAEDVLYGSSGAIAGGLNIIDDPYKAIDGDIASFATLNGTASVLNKTHVTALYPTLSIVGDSIRLIIQNPGGSLLNATLLAENFAIHTYNDNFDNGALDFNSDFLRLSLLPDAENVQVLTFPIDLPFNRIEISIGNGIAHLLNSLNIYEIERISKGPVVLNVTGNEYEVCEEEPINLNIDNPQAGITYKWYTEPIGGIPIETTDSYNPGVLAPGEHIYYVSATKAGCTAESGRTMVEVRVDEAAVAVDITLDDATICVGFPAILTPSSTLTNPVYKWYKDINKAAEITDGLTEGVISYAIDASGALTVTGLTADATYYVSVDGDEKCENQAGALEAGTITVNTTPAAPEINIAE